MARKVNDSVVQVDHWKLLLVINELWNDGESAGTVQSGGSKETGCSNSWKNKGPNKCDKVRLYTQRALSLARHLTTAHRWDGVVKLFPLVARLVLDYPAITWKVGMLGLANHPESNSEFMKKFVRSIVQVGRGAAAEILLDYITYLLGIGNFSEAKTFMNLYKKKAIHVSSKKVEAVLNGFNGLLEYISWLQQKELSKKDLELPGNQQADVSEDRMNAVAERSVTFLLESTHTTSNCDLFISRLCDILDYYNRVEELELVLTSYLEKKPDHPTPYIFMYKFLRRYHPDDKSQQISVLKKLMQCCPSDCFHGLALCELLPENELDEKVEILMNLLDFQEWKDNVTIWKALVQALTADANGSRDLSNVCIMYKVLWRRSSWWPDYHFHCETIIVNDKSTAQLEVCKAIVLAIMCSTDMPYIQKVQKILEDSNWQEELEQFQAIISEVPGYGRPQRKSQRRKIPLSRREIEDRKRSSSQKSSWSNEDDQKTKAYHNRKRRKLTRQCQKL